MSARLVPSDSELVRLRDSGMTHQQIADKISKDTGHPVARSTVSVALHRAGEQKEKRIRYKREVPWTVPTRFTTEYPLRMLRLLGRSRSKPIDDNDQQLLDGWLEELQTRGLIVAFCPDPPPGQPGFYYIPSSGRDHDDEDTPIRRAPVTPSQIGY